MFEFSPDQLAVYPVQLIETQISCNPIIFLKILCFQAFQKGDHIIGIDTESKQPELVDGIYYVQTGVAHIVDRSREGFTVVRP